MGRFGDGIGVARDLGAAASLAVEAALRPLRGVRPDLACVFVSGGDPADAAEAGVFAGQLTGAATVLGCTADGVLGAGRALEREAAVSVWLGVFPGARLRAFHLEVMRADEGLAVVGLPEQEPGDEVLLLLADAGSFPVDGFVRRAATTLPGLPVVGGVAGGQGAARLWLDGRAVDRGAVGVVLAGTGARALVSQGCRAVGPAMTVTAAAGNRLAGLAGRPALDKVRDLLVDLPPADQALASAGLQLGLAADEYAEDHDFLVRAILGTDDRALLVGDLVEVGRTVRLQVRDADAADADLRGALARHGSVQGGGALLFSCTGRGSGLFGPSYGGAGHDVTVVQEALGADAVAGFFAGGELGPVAGRSALHTFTASVLAFP